MMLLAHLRKILVKATPTFFYPLIRSMMNSDIYNHLQQQLGFSFYNISWQTISQGKFKGIKLLIDPNSDVWQHEILTGKYDEQLFNYLAKLPIKHKTIFDIGAHIGYSSLCFAKLTGNKGKIISFEPNQFNLVRFKANIDANSDLSQRIKIEHKAISNKTGKSDFIFSSIVDDFSSSGSYLKLANTFYQKNVYQEQLGFKKTRVATDTIDNYVRQQKVIPYLLKIDVEGAESLVLEGASRTLSKIKPIVIIELHSIRSCFDVMCQLSKCSYKITLLHQEPDGRCLIVGKYKK